MCTRFFVSVWDVRSARSSVGIGSGLPTLILHDSLASCSWDQPTEVHGFCRVSGSALRFGGNHVFPLRRRSVGTKLCSRDTRRHRTR